MFYTFGINVNEKSNASSKIPRDGVTLLPSCQPADASAALPSHLRSLGTPPAVCAAGQELHLLVPNHV